MIKTYDLPSFVAALEGRERKTAFFSDSVNGANYRACIATLTDIGMVSLSQPSWLEEKDGDEIPNKVRDARRSDRWQSLIQSVERHFDVTVYAGSLDENSF